MRYGKLIIILLTLVLLAATVLALTQEEPAQTMARLPFVFEVEGEDWKERIRPWRDLEGTWYVFLPASGQMDRLRLCLKKDSDSVILDGREMTDGASMAFIPLEQPCSLVYTWEGKTSGTTITFLRSGNLPSMHIDVFSGSMEYLNRNKNNKENGWIRLYGETGQLLCAEEIFTMKGRGNTSWDANKKPYNITLARPWDLLGMGAAQHWVLLEEEYNDINIRNKIVFDYAGSLGLPGTPDSRWVDLYLNGEYMGLYLLAEHIELHPERLDIGREGSFLVSLEYESRLQKQKYPYVLTEAGQALRVRHGTSNMAAIQARWQQAENAILAPDGIDPVSGKHWRELIDLDSWARKYLIEEIFGNQDAGSLSQYFYFDGTDSQGKIMAGPVWDYDFAMDDQSVWITGFSNFYTMNRSHVNEDVHTPWFPALYRQEEFYQRVTELYETEFLPRLQVLISQDLPAYAEWIHPSARLDRIRWYSGWEKAQQTAGHIQSFLQKRETFLTDMWIQGAEYHTVCVDADRDLLWGYIAVKDGERLPKSIIEAEVDGLGWHNADTGEPFYIGQPISEDVSIYIKKQETNLPLIHYLPVLAVAGLLVLMMLLDGYRRTGGRKKRQKHPAGTS